MEGEKASVGGYRMAIAGQAGGCQKEVGNNFWNGYKNGVMKRFLIFMVLSVWGLAGQANPVERLLERIDPGGFR